MAITQVYDSEKQKIFEVGTILNQKWFDLCRYMDLDNPGSKKNVERMQRWANEAVSRYHDIGFKVFVDLAPAINGQKPPSIVFEERVNQITFDHDKMASEVKKSA